MRFFFFSIVFLVLYSSDTATMATIVVGVVREKRMG